MSVVTLARLVVVPEYADLVDDERQPIFESVCRAWHRPRQAPYYNLDEYSGIQHVPFINQQLGLHVGLNNNTKVVLSMTTTKVELASIQFIDQESLAGSVLPACLAGEIIALIRHARRQAGA
jgi:hypothetical protein